MENAMTDKLHYKNGKLHREDGPAIEREDGSKEWRIDGKLHRLDGPAYEDGNRYKSWWIDGKRHRVDGPAVEYVGGYKEWWVNNKHLTEEQFNNHPKVQYYRFNVLLEEVLSNEKQMLL